MKNERGSALITAIILSAVMATLVGSYIRAAMLTRDLADRALNTNAAVDIAEAGIEAGLWAYNRDEWTGWTDVTSDKKRIGLSAFMALRTGAAFPNFDLERAVKADATVVVYDYAAPQPIIVVQAKVWNTRNPGKTEVQRWIKTTLRKRSFFATGLVAKDALRFSGTRASVDAFDSRLGPYNCALPAGGTNRFDLATIATTAVDSTMDVQNADIWGSAAFGGSDVSEIDVGPRGVIGPFGTGLGDTDREYVSADFRAELPDAEVPDTTGALPVPTTPSITLVGSSDPDHPTLYSTTDISIIGFTNELAITGHVRLVCTSLTITGGSTRLYVPTGSSIEIHCSGDLAIAGQGIVNPSNDAAAVQIYGTAPTGFSQSFSIRGGGSLAAAVYAPNAEVAINGDGDVFGSFVGRTINVTGNALFHHDLALTDMTEGRPATISLWLELLDPAVWPMPDFS